MTGVQTCALPINDTAYEIVKSDWSSDVCSSDLLERMMRDAKITEIYEGTSEVQRMVIASHLGVK